MYLKFLNFNIRTVVMRNERKANLSIMLSIIALFLIIAIVVIWCISTKEFSVVTGDTFISTCIGLISLALPIIIGYQIINSLDIKHSLKTEEEKNEKYKTDTTNLINNYKDEFNKELNKILEINEKLRNSVEIERKERELIYQDMKVAIYHGNAIQNSALALQEHIHLIKLLIELDRTDDLNENIKRSFTIIKGICRRDFHTIKPSNDIIIPYNPIGFFDLDKYELDIKKQIRDLPQINEKFMESIILMEKSLDCMIQALKDNLNDGLSDTYAKIDGYLNQISENL